MAPSSSRPPRGIWLNSEEVDRMGVVRQIGATFETDQLDIFPAVFTVLELTEDGGARVERLAAAGANAPPVAAPKKSGTMPRVVDPSVATPKAPQTRRR